MALEITPGALIQTGAAAGAQQVWQRTGLPGQVPMSAGAAIRTGVTYGAQKASEATGIPITVPTDFNTQVVAQAGYDTLKNYGEKAVQAETGIPIKFPKKLNAKEIGRSIGAIIPTSIEGALDTALTVGAQTAASALTSLVVGAAAGSVVPGLGTVIGIGVALGVNVLKNLIRKSPVFKAIATVVKYTPLGLSLTLAKEILKPFSKLFAAEPPPSQVKCKTPWKCPSVPAGIDALGLITWTTRRLDSPQARALRREMGGTFGGGPTWAISGAHCGTGEAVACATYMRQLRLEAASFSLGTPATMGLLAVNATLEEFTRLPEDLDVYGNWKRFGDFPQLMWQLQVRQVELQRFVADAARGFVGRFQAVTEFHKAAVAFQAAPTTATQQWLKFTFDVVNRIVQAEDARLKAMQAEQVRRQTQGEQQIKQDPHGSEMRTARAGCQLGNQIACARLRQLQGGGTTPTPQPVPAPRPTTPTAVDPARTFCWGLYQDWLKKNPQQASCLTTVDRDWILKFCYDAHGLKRFTVPEAMSRIQMVISMACKKKGIAA